MCEQVKFEAENDQLKRDLLKYGAHTVLCTSLHWKECICGFDEVKKQALVIIIEDQRRMWSF